MDFKNKAIPYKDKDGKIVVTSYDVNKSIQRSLTKACARHGLGLFVFEGEDLPEAVAQLGTLRTEAFNQVKKKAQISEDAKKKVSETCKEYIQSGDPREMEDPDALKELIKKLKAIRK